MSELSNARKVLINNVAVAVTVMSVNDGTLEVETRDLIHTSLDGIHSMLVSAITSYHKNLADLPEEELDVAANQMGIVAGSLAGLTVEESLKAGRDNTPATTEG
jgi:hypothetical protein